MKRKLLSGFQFRTKTPSFDPDSEIEVMVTGETDDGYVARIGDTVLDIEGAPAGALDTRIRARVVEFDEAAHRGIAEYLETVGQSSF